MANRYLSVRRGIKKYKRLSDEEIGLLIQNSIPFTCEVNCGGIQLMKPFLLHSSSKTVDQSLEGDSL